MSNLWLRYVGEYDPATESIEEAMDRVVTVTNKNIEGLKHLLYGKLSSSNINEIDADIVRVRNLVVGDNVGEGSVPKIFYTTPVTPYKIKDIWLDGVDLYRCVVTRESGSYVEEDWELGTNYTNPTGVTSIVGGVVTTDYVNALSVTAGSVAAENISGTTITGKIIRTAASGTRVEITSDHAFKCYSAGGSVTGYFSNGAYGSILSGGGNLQVTDGAYSIGGSGSGLYLGGHTVTIGAYSGAYYQDGSANQIIATRGWVTTQVKAETADHSNTASHNHGGETADHSNTASHNHGIASGYYVYVKEGEGGTPGWVGWSPYAGATHKHTISNFTGQTHKHTI